MYFAGGAAFFAMREWEQREAVRPAFLLAAPCCSITSVEQAPKDPKKLHTQAEGKPVNHQLAKELLAGLVRGFPWSLGSLPTQLFI